MLIPQSANPYIKPPKRQTELEKEWRAMSEQERASFYGSFARFREVSNGK